MRSIADRKKRSAFLVMCSKVLLARMLVEDERIWIRIKNYINQGIHDITC